jgi:hypothetical protein
MNRHRRPLLRSGALLAAAVLALAASVATVREAEASTCAPRPAPLLCSETTTCGSSGCVTTARYYAQVEIT